MAQLQRIKQHIQRYHQAHQPARGYSILLQQLSQQIPERCWLMALRQQGDVLSFEVISRDYATINAFLAMLGRQPLLVNVSLQGITQQDEGGFRFVVHASWRDENHHVEGHHAEGHDIDGHHVAGDYE
ncbi:fimbrial assembly family protein [Yersinia pseudotuberculosis]|nr:fimbrial assembly family protein [Yersinia pseudotuberculosis]CNB75721.1 fimbrial assembly family protein [Yersinia pseudotuberculosis]CNC33789.1 fimbrial assembly family protein [Yersinia pseudotuberculosis]CRY60872.1 fimbrial assembly family protein [Yersinia pseudotuberculosis]